MGGWDAAGEACGCRKRSEVCYRCSANPDQSFVCLSVVMAGSMCERVVWGCRSDKLVPGGDGKMV